MANLHLGEYDQAIHAAIAYDLAARLLDKPRQEFNFTDKRLTRLVVRYADDVVAGLNKGLPTRLRGGIIGLIDLLRG
jgi:hypothetical protein